MVTLFFDMFVKISLFNLHQQSRAYLLRCFCWDFSTSLIQVFGDRNLNFNQMNQETNKKIAPETIVRIDQAHQSRPGDSGGYALKDNETWRHGGRKLSRAEKNWLERWNWPLPNDQ